MRKRYRRDGALIVKPVQDLPHQQLKGGGGGKPGAGGHTGIGISQEAAGGVPFAGKTRQNSTDQRGGMAPFHRIMGKIPPIDGRQRVGGGSDLNGAQRLRRDSGQLIQRHGRRQHPPVLMISVVAAQFGTAGRAEKTHLFPFPELPGKALQQLQIALPVRQRIFGNI